MLRISNLSTGQHGIVHTYNMPYGLQIKLDVDSGSKELSQWRQKAGKLEG